MELGSDLYNIFISIAFLIFVVVVIYLIRAIFLANKLKYELHRVKNLRIFAISNPERPTEVKTNKPQDVKEKIAAAEQFFSSLGSLYEGELEKKLYDLQHQISLEIVVHDGKIGFYCTCPRELEGVIERQLNSAWPHAKIVKAESPNIFKAPGSVMASAELKLVKKSVLPIKTYKYLETDPLTAITNAMTKLGPGAGAAYQLIIAPTSDIWQRKSFIAAKKVQEGKPIMADKWYLKILSFLFELATGAFHSPKKEETGNFKKPIQLTPIQEQTLKAIQEKQAKTGFQSVIRLVAIAPHSEEAKMNLKNITTAFGQFGAPDANSFKVKGGSQETVQDYILRRISKNKYILNTEELASIFHLPSEFTEAPNINWLRAKEMAPPVNLPEDGTIIGESIYRGVVKPVKIKSDDRRRHIFMIGKTGVGKTTLFTSAFEQDIAAGSGGCFIDPLGDAIEDLLGKIPPERANDVILFDPSDVEFPVGLNLLEYQTAEQRDYLIQETIEIFYKLFDPNRTGMVGPQWEHWFRNAALTVMNQPGGGTLIDIPRIFTDDAFRTKLAAAVTDPIVKAFWDQQLAKTADFHKSEMYNYFISKFGRFMTNDLMRNIIGQKKSAFDLREAMDQGKIILINLSKGKIGEVNSNLLGMVLVSKIQIAAFSRADMPEDQRRDFYLYVDEFQNFTTDTFATILSEARKYRLNLNVTNQYIAQLAEKIRDAVVGNVGTMICYRIGAADAEFMVKEFPGVTADDMVNLDTYNTYSKLLIDGTPSKPFSMKGYKSPTQSNAEMREKIRNLSRQRFARPRQVVEEEIAVGLKATAAAPPAGANEPIRNL